MAASKKTAKSKLIPEDVSAFMNQSQFLKDSPKGKKPQKRQRNDQIEEDDMVRLIGQYQASVKKKKVGTNVENEGNAESRQKILDLVGHQLEARKQCNENLFKSLEDITTQVEADYNAMKENEQKLEHLTGTYMKCIQQATTAYKHKLKALKEVQVSFKKEYEGLESNHKAETEKLVDELDYDIKQLQDKLVTESKRNSWESVRRNIFHAMQNAMQNDL